MDKKLIKIPPNKEKWTKQQPILLQNDESKYTGKLANN